MSTPAQNIDYAQQAREYHQKMISHVQIMSSSADISPPIFESRASQSSTSSSSLASWPSPAPNHDALRLYDATPQFEHAFPPTQSPSGFNKNLTFQPDMGYAQLYDGRSETAPRQFKAPFIDVSVTPQTSTFDPMMNPFGVSSGVFGYAQPQLGAMPFSQSINPECLANQSADEELDGPGSPLQSVSGSESPFPAFDDLGGIKSRLRRTSEPTGCGGSPEPRMKKHRRKMTWTPGMANEGPNVPQTQKERELMELSRLEQGGAATRRERRRLQNRLAQRAFRARSKVQNQEAATHLTDLEKLAEMQADQLRKMNEALENLQRENNQLKAETWAKANAERAHYNKGAPP